MHLDWISGQKFRGLVKKIAAVAPLIVLGIPAVSWASPELSPALDSISASETNPEVALSPPVAAETPETPDLVLSLGLTPEHSATEIAPSLLAQAPNPTPAPAPVPDEVPLTTSTEPIPTPELIPLNPNPKPLNLPTVPAQVNIDLTKPITLQQAIELGIRNSLALQVAEQQLRQSRAALQQAEADLYPALAWQTTMGRGVSPTGQLINFPLNQQQQLQLQQQQLQQTQQELSGQQQEASRVLQNQLNRLQQRFQGPQITTFNDQQNLELQQLIQQLQSNAAIAATPPVFRPISLSPLTLNPGSFNTVPGFANFRSTNATGGTIIGNTFNSTLTLNYNLWTSGSRDGAIKAAQEQVRLSALEVQRQLDQLVLDITNDYLNAQQANVQQQIGQAAVTNAQISLRDAVAFERAGLGTLLDVLQAELNVANAQQNLNQAENLQVTSRRQLAQRLNLNDDMDITLADAVRVGPNWNLSLEETITLAFQNRVELEQRIAQRNIALQNRRVALAAIQPQVGAFANFNVFDELTDSVSPQYGYAVGLQISLALFDGGNAKASAGRQESLAAIAAEQFASTRDEIRFQIEQGYNTLVSSKQNIGTARTALTSATEGLRLARLRFQAGVGTQQEVTNAEANLTQAQGNLLTAILNYNRALALLERSVGYSNQIDGFSLTERVTP